MNQTDTRTSDSTTQSDCTESLRSRRRAARLGAAAVLVAAVVVYGALCIAGGGLPFVTDNNESFSSLRHAENLATQDFSKSWGLTDDTASPHDAAHPFVHTHQGNFPRLYATLIYVLGARTIESQIVVTTFTVGLASILMAYLLFVRAASPPLAVLACLFLLTDYVLFAQWQVVTYRVWYTFLVFSTLHCMHGLGGERRRWWMLLTIVNFMCLYYFEYVFAIFVTIAACAYALMLYWRQWRIFLPAAGVSALGAVLGCGILLAQLVAYMGFDGVLYDAWLTVNARNESAEISQQARDFYNSHNILFWENYSGGSDYRDFAMYMRAMLTYNVGPYSPLLVLVVSMVLTGVAVSTLDDRMRHSRVWRGRFEGAAAYGKKWRAVLDAVDLFGLARFATLWGGWCLLLFALLRDRSFAGVDAETTGGVLLDDGASTALAAVFAFFICGWNNRTATGSWWIGSRTPWYRIAAAAAVLVIYSAVIRKLGRWCSQSFVPIWNDLDEFWMLRTVGRMLVILAAAVTVAMIVGRWRRIPQRHLQLAGFKRFFLAGLIGYTCVYLLSAGYVHTGYLHRWAPFLVFFTNPLIALAVYILFVTLRWEILRIRRWWRPKSVRWRAGVTRDGWLPMMRGAVFMTAPLGAVAALLLFIVAFWGHLQSKYVTLMPPDQLAVYDLLRKEPFRGKSFIVNTYALPTACGTGQWAYYDPMFGTEPVELGADGYRVKQDSDTYLWFADRSGNNEYKRPEYFLYMTYQDPTVTPYLRQMDGTEEGRLASPLTQCADRICREDGPLQNRVVSRDPSGRDRWMIIELDWSFPPYLQPLGDRQMHGDDFGDKVEANLSQDSQGVHVQVAYRYTHQEGEPEHSSRVRLYRVHADAPRELLTEQRGNPNFDLPVDFQGNLQASVLPCTSEKEGEESFSRIFRIGDVPSLAPPHLAELNGETPNEFVKAELTREPNGPLLHVDYEFQHDDGEMETGTVVRLYLQSPDGALSLWSETEQTSEIPVSPELWWHAAERRAEVRVSVTPKTQTATGQEYFCHDCVSLECQYRPFLHVLSGGGEPPSGQDAKHVQVVVAEKSDAAELNVVYAYGHPLGAKESGTTLRVYCEREDGSYRLAKQESDVRQIVLHRPPGRRLRVSVTPNDGTSTGPEYFSEPLELGEWR